MFITLASTKVAFLVDVALVFLLLWKLKISIATYNGESENWPLLSHCRYLNKSFTEMFLALSSAKHITGIFFQISEIDWLPW